MSSYRDPVIDKIIKVLEANGPRVLKGRYMNGDVLNPQKRQLPLCYIAKDQVMTQPANNMEDEHLVLLVATVILDTATNIKDAYDIVQGVPDLWEICEKRDPETYELLPNTLLYQLHNSQQVAHKFWLGIGTPVQINYGMGVERRGPGIFSIEATIRFTVRLHLPAPGAQT